MDEENNEQRYSVTEDERHYHFKEAERQGFEIVVADDLTLQIDLDDTAAGEEWKKPLKEQIRRLVEFGLMKVIEVYYTHSKSNLGYHVTIKLKSPLKLRRRILL